MGLGIQQSFLVGLEWIEGEVSNAGSNEKLSREEAFSCWYCDRDPEDEIKDDHCSVYDFQGK